MLTSHWIRVHSGCRFDLLDPKPTQMHLKDIVHSLSLVNRFNGHTKIPYTVLNHLIVCHDLGSKKYRKERISHDFSEAWLGDISSRLKDLLPDYKKIEYDVEAIVAKKFNLIFPYPKEVKKIDLLALKWEMRDLMKGGDYKQLPYDIPEEKLIPMDRETCVREFYKRYNKLYK